MRNEVYERDDFTCQFCKTRLSSTELTIDHLVPLSLGGLDEITNYVTCCKPCNQHKADVPLAEFAETVRVEITELPVHGDPVIDNKALPIQIRLLRKRIFDKHRQEELRLGGRQAQQKLEKAYRTEFWQTPDGKALEAEFPTLPGHARIMIPEIQTIAKTSREFWLLVELAKSASTRNLIGSILTADCDVENRVRELEMKAKNEGFRRRLRQAIARFEREVRKRALK